MCTKEGEQYGFVTVGTQGHIAELDDILWVQVWGRGGQGDVGEDEEEEEKGGREQGKERRDDSDRIEHRTDRGGEAKVKNRKRGERG